VGARPISGSILIIGMLVVAIASPGQLAWSQSSGTTDYEVKTAFLFNFAKFIDWPPNSFASPQSTFTICVLGQNPFGNILDDALQGKMIGDRPLVVRRLRDKTEARQCQMVFISSSESAHLAEIIGSLNGANVLLVSDINGFATSGGTIEFTLDDNHVGFRINTDAVGRSGLKFSSKLLALAKIVHDEGHSKGG
jgi:YfiR/HmsC-like